MIRALLKFAFVMWKDVDGLIISVPRALGQNVANCHLDDVCSSQNVGSGWGNVFIPGLKWTVGPYMFRAVYVYTRYNSVDPGLGRGMSGKGWTIDNQLMVWSPKGF